MGLGTRIVALRKQRKWTQEDLARRIKRSKGYISMLESGKRHPSFKLARRLSGLLGVSVAQIYEDRAAS